MQIELKYGKGILEFELDPNNWTGTLFPSTYETVGDESSIIKSSLQNPINSGRLGEVVNQGETVAIITSDISRPMPSYKVLPHVLSELYESGIKPEDITIVLALGSHRGHTDDEKAHLVGRDVFESEVTVIDSDMNDCVNLGICKNGTPVDVFRPVVNSDRIICLGNIEYHYFAGYSGGAKAIMPGVSSHEAIQANHRNMVHIDAVAANLVTNPVRQDIDQVPEFIDIDFIVNVVLNAKKEVIGAFSGHWKTAHRKGCDFLDGIYGIKIDGPSDIVIVSPGGFPKDLNLYQAHKGLDNAKHAVKDGGTIIFCASAKEGFGEHVFEKWMLTMTASQRVAEIKRNFKLGGHKAAAIGLVQEKVEIIMVTDLEKEIVQKIGFTYCSSIDEAIEIAQINQGRHAKILVMPAAGSTLPIIR